MRQLPRTAWLKEIAIHNEHQKALALEPLEKGLMIGQAYVFAPEPNERSHATERSELAADFPAECEQESVVPVTAAISLECERHRPVQRPLVAEK